MSRKKYKALVKPAATRIAAGIDVHKYKLQAFVLGHIDETNRPLGEQVFKNDVIGREEACKYLAGYYPNDIVMEKTGVLSNPVVKALNKFRGWKGGTPRITVVPPDTLKRFPGEVHTDPRSARNLAILGVSGIIKSIYMPSKVGRQLRQLSRELDGFTKQSTALINEIKDYLAGLGYTMPKFNITTVWGLAFIRLLLMEGIDGNIETLYDLIENGHVNMHHTSKQAILAKKQEYIGYAHLIVSRFDAWFIGRKLAMLAMVEAEKEACAKHIENHLKEHPILKEQIRRIKQIPGIGAGGAVTIVAETGDPSRFATYKKYQLYAGRAIAPDTSGEARGKDRMTKRCNHRLKRVFKQAGRIALSTVKTDSDIRRYALRQRGKHPRNPSIAAANTSTKIVRIVYKIMHDDAIYDPFHELRRKSKQELSSVPGEDPCWKPRLKDARNRARRFRNFTTKMVNQLPPSDVKCLLSKVLAAFEELSP